MFFRGLRRYATYNRFAGQRAEIKWNDPKTLKVSAAVVSVSGIFYLSNLEEAPVTHRTRFLWVPEWLERYLAASDYNDTLNQYRGRFLAENHPTVKNVKSVMSRIIKVGGETKLDWKVHVVHDPQAPPNAFVLPGGKVFVFSSILPICQNDDGLATVLAHEYAHQMARHAAEGLSKSPIYAIFGIALNMLFSGTVGSFFSTALLRLPASREMETEADYIGLMLMAEACFDPKAAGDFWKRMVATSQMSIAGGRPPPEFLSTHPSNKNRILNIEQWLPEAERRGEMNNCSQYGTFKSFFTAPQEEPISHFF